MILEVTVPTTEIFDSYYYGYGEVVDGYPLLAINHAFPKGRCYLYQVNYGDDHYRAMCQRDRFQSGLYWATLRPSDNVR